MTVFNVPDIGCDHSKATIEKAIGETEASATVSFDRVACEIGVSSCLTDEGVAALLNKEGYPSTITV
ncbi:copper chaperone [Alisedimentitalea sp. MJ-SS2]|uniref:copper chaperone n=1 Tax=Aliisedimentitalea sp. MJ-SS2 TaxID=3049795 RepID=UPI0029093FA3|nr:copper chaperone [Alisedimentitalea sp. MJ-SS2]MDU8929828.1 copper chaperone [Alisedimentitalea sp. MJ-SS2]